jgi:putative serine protease PepD
MTDPQPAYAGPTPAAGTPQSPYAAPPGGQHDTTPLWGQSAAPHPPYGEPPAPPPDAPAAPAAPRRTGRLLTVAAAAVVLALGSGLAGGYIEHRLDGAPAATPTVNKTFPAAPIIERSSLANIAETVQPSVVNINTGGGEGSGVILSADGAILTNNHVVATATGSTMVVTFNDGSTARATIVGTDPGGDLAVIKAQNVSGLRPAKFGDSDGVRVGDTVLALGSPLGLQGSVTAGIVSALHRTIHEGGGPDGPRRSIGEAIQTDAAINPGNSGGALVNTNGEVVGINTAIATAGQDQGNIGVGFAISSNRAKSAADTILKGGKVTHPILGVQLNDAAGGGAFIADVAAGSPAEKAGLQRGDIVTKVGSKPVNNANDLVDAVQSAKPGDELVLTVRQDGNERQVKAVLAGA